jgi:hypothetical protein
VIGSSTVTIAGLLAVVVLAYAGLPEASTAPLTVAVTAIIAGYVASLTGVARLVEIGEKLSPLDADNNRNTQSGTERVSEDS